MGDSGTRASKDVQTPRIWTRPPQHFRPSPKVLVESHYVRNGCGVSYLRGKTPGLSRLRVCVQRTTRPLGFGHSAWVSGFLKALRRARILQISSFGPQTPQVWWHMMRGGPMSVFLHSARLRAKVTPPSPQAKNPEPTAVATLKACVRSDDLHAS